VAARVVNFGVRSARRRPHDQKVNLVSDLQMWRSCRTTHLVLVGDFVLADGRLSGLAKPALGVKTIYAVRMIRGGFFFSVCAVSVLSGKGSVVAFPVCGQLVTGRHLSGMRGFHGDLFIVVSEDGTVSGWSPRWARRREPWCRAVSNGLQRIDGLASTVERTGNSGV